MKPRKRKTPNHKTRAPRKPLMERDNERVACHPASFGKMNFRRSDWRHPLHPDHVKQMHGGDECICHDKTLTPTQYREAMRKAEQRKAA